MRLRVSVVGAMVAVLGLAGCSLGTESANQSVSVITVTEHESSAPISYPAASGAGSSGAKCIHVRYSGARGNSTRRFCDHIDDSADGGFRGRIR